MEIGINASKKPVPIVGKRYYHYEDGKATLSCEHMVEIEKVVPFGEMEDEAVLELWNRERARYKTIYAQETECFALSKCHKVIGAQVYVRAFDGGWFSLENPYCGDLDTDGTMRKKSMTSQMGAVPKEGRTYSHCRITEKKQGVTDDVTIAKVVSYSEMKDMKILERWKRHSMADGHLYNCETDYFVSTVPNDRVCKQIYVRSSDNGWVSLRNKDAGRLAMEETS